MTAPAAAILRASHAVEDRMFRALAGLRVVVLVNAVALAFIRDTFDRPALGWTCIGLMVLWTGLAIWLFSAAERRTTLLLVVDLALAAGLMLATPIVKGPDFNATIPGFWIAGALLAWGLRLGWRGGLAAAVLLGGVDLLSRDHVSQNNYGHVFLILLAGPLLGFVSESLKQLAAERDAAQRQAAAAAERVRLARVVHDGVLQVLALMQRRGAEAGGDLAELGRLAGEQEEALRTLIRTQYAVTGHDEGDDVAPLADLAAALAALGSRPGVEVAVPGGAVELPRPVVDELLAVVCACLDNVTRHVGEGAPVWVLLEDLGDTVELSVRDEGPGIPEGRLAAASAEGRLGISESIEGRIRDLGGVASLNTGAFGTEWEFTLIRWADR